MALNVPLAIRMTPYFAKSAGWKDQVDNVCGLLGFSGSYPDAQNFVTAVQRWQLTHQLDPDGMLGPDTWKKMKPAVNSYSGQVPVVGPHPKWIYAMDPAANIPAARHPGQIPNPKQSDAEDRIIKEWARTAVESKLHPELPVAVSNEYLGSLGYPNGLKTLRTNSNMSQTLEVGQVWQGILGKRTIVGLQYGGLTPDRTGTDGVVLFMTESGQGYVERATAWDSDMWAAVYYKVGQSLAPLQKMLDVEVALLMGLISGVSLGGAAAIVVLSGLQWTLKNRAKFPYWSDAISAGWKLDQTLEKIAPTLEKKLYWALVKDTGLTFAKSLKEPENIARFVGQLIATRGMAVFTETFPMLALSFKTVMIGSLKDLGADIGPELEALDPAAFLRQIKLKLGVNPLKQPGWVGAGVHSLPGEVVRGVEHTPGAELDKLKFKNFADVAPILQKLGADVSPSDAEKIEKEIADHYMEIVNAFMEVADAVAKIPPGDDD
jgi:hypothetical protein